MANKDDLLIDEVEAAFRSAHRTFREAGPVAQSAMLDNLQRASIEWVRAQIKLVEKDELATQQMLGEMRKIKDAIDDAANTQEVVIALGRLVGFLLTV